MARTVQELMALVQDYPCALYVSGILIHHDLDPVCNAQGEPLTHDEILTEIEQTPWDTEAIRTAEDGTPYRLAEAPH